MALGHIVLLSLAAFCGGFTQGLTGFGSTDAAEGIHSQRTRNAFGRQIKEN